MPAQCWRQCGYNKGDDASATSNNTSTILLMMTAAILPRKAISPRMTTLTWRVTLPRMAYWPSPWKMTLPKMGNFAKEGNFDTTKDGVFADEGNFRQGWQLHRGG